MITTIIIAVLTLIALASFAVAFLFHRQEIDYSDEASVATITGGVFLTIALLITVFASTTIVPPRTVGVKVAFGKPVGVVNNGLHIKAPWTKIEKLDGAVQNDVYNGDHTITVRLGNNSRAETDVSVQWQMKTDNAEKLFLDYKTFDSIRSNLVDRNLRAALNESMSDYNPLASVDKANASNAGIDLDKMGQDVRKRLEDKIGADVKVISVTIPIIKFDDSTQGKIDELQAEIARTRVAEQKKQTADAERQANEILDRSVSDNVLTSKCLDIVERSNVSPLGCFPGASGQPIIGSK